MEELNTVSRGLRGCGRRRESAAHVFSEAPTFEKVQVQTDFSWSLNPALTETTDRAWIIAADFRDKSKPVVRVTLERSVVYVFHPLPTLGRHRHLRHPWLLLIPDSLFADFDDADGIDRPVRRRDRQSAFSHQFS
jgi:hypothetical protein